MDERLRIARLADEIAARYPVSQIILFGSHVGGCASADSDVDLLLIVDEPPREPEFSVEVRCGVSYEDALDILVWTQEEFDRRYDEFNPIARDARNRGVVLYDRRTATVA